MHLRLGLIIFLFALNCAFSQTKEQLIKNDARYIKELLKTQKRGKDKIEKEVFDQFYNSLQHRISRGYEKDNFILDEDYLNFIHHSFQRIYDSNEIIKDKKFKFYLEKENLPNASSAGHHLYFINSGLFSIAENDEQFIAVICHEIAHDYLKHVEKSLIQKAEFRKDFNREMKSIKRRDFLKLIKSQDEVLRKKYDLAAQSRAEEIEADSLGFIFYSRLGFDPNEYYKVLMNLNDWQEKEENKSIQDSIYRYLFDLPELDFDENWLEIDYNDPFQGLTFTEHIDKDSISTHPNLKDRIEWLQNKFNIQDEMKSSSASDGFLELKNKTSTDFFDIFYTNQEYGIALYELLYRIQENSEQIDKNKHLGFIFTQLYESKMNYTFNKYIPQYDRNSDDLDFQKFVNFLWKLSNEEIKTIGQYYNSKANQ